MKQLTLVKEKRKKKVIPKEKAKILIESGEEDFEKKHKETVAWAEITYFCKVAVNGTKEEWLQLNTNLSIKPYPQKHSTYGGHFGGWTDYSKKDVKKLLGVLLDFKKRELALPYTDDLKNAYRYTNLKSKNIYILVKERGIKFIEENGGIKWADFLKKFNSISNIKLTEKYDRFAKREIGLEQGIKNIEKILQEKIKYIKGLLDNTPDKNSKSDKQPNELFKEKANIDEKLAELRTELEGIKKELDNFKGG